MRCGCPDAASELGLTCRVGRRAGRQVSRLWESNPGTYALRVRLTMAGRVRPRSAVVCDGCGDLVRTTATGGQLQPEVQPLRDHFVSKYLRRVQVRPAAQGKDRRRPPGADRDRADCGVLCGVAARGEVLRRACGRRASTSFAVLSCSAQVVTLLSPGRFARWSGCGLAVTARVLCGRLQADPWRASQVCGA